MALAVAELERIKRGAPDFERLERLVDAGLGRHLEQTGERVSRRHLGELVGFSPTLISDMLRLHKRTEREALTALADFFDDPREEWLEAAGFDVASLPRDRGYTTQERTVARLLGALSGEEKAALIKRLIEENRRADAEE